MSAGEPPLRASVARGAGGAVVVSLAGELDLATADRLRTRLSDLVQADPPPPCLVLDLAALDFVDASGISVLIGAQRELATRGGRVVLRAPSRMVRRVVQVLDLESVLPVES